MPNAYKLLTLGKLLPSCLDKLSRQRVGFSQRFTRFLVLLRVLNGDAYLICQRSENVNIFLVEGIWLGALHIERANDLTSNAEWEGDFRARFRQVWVFEENSIFTSIQSNAWFSYAGYKTNNTRLTDF